MSTEHPKINPKCREEKVLLQAASLCTNPQHNRGLCKCGGLTSDKKLQKICSACNKMQFSLPKPYSGLIYSHFFPYFASVLFRIFFAYSIILNVTSSLEGSLSGGFLKTWCDLVLLHGILCAPWNPFLLHHPLIHHKLVLMKGI